MKRSLLIFAVLLFLLVGMVRCTQKNGVKRSAAGAEIMECYKEIAALKVLETKTPPKA